MRKIVLDQELRTRLGGGVAKVTLIDEAGNPVGHFLPDDLYKSICDALSPPGETDRSQAREEFQRGEAMATPKMLAGLRESLARWDGLP